MDTLSYILVIAGLVVLLIGLYFVVRPPALPQPTGGTPQKLEDIGEIVKQVVELVKLVDQKLRIGLIVILVGLTLVGLGVLLAIKDTRDEVKETKTTPTALVRPRG